MNKQMKDIRYKENPITEAIARIDFLNVIIEFRTEIHLDLGNVIKKIFPITESKELISRELQIEPNKEVKQLETKSTEWNFYDKKRNKRLCITENSMFIVHNKYEKYENFHDDFDSILDALFKYKPEIQVKRFGVRYINNIENIAGNPFDWNEIVNNNLLTIFDIPNDKSLISRAFHNLELNCGDYNVRFQYGMHNPDYPAPIKKKVFILDFDAYYGGIMSKADIEEFFPKFHLSIQELFEKSITNKYRKALND